MIVIDKNSKIRIMELQKLKTLSKIFCLSAIVFFSSCTEDTETTTDNANEEDKANLINSVEVDQIDVAIGDIVVDAFESQESLELGRSFQTPALPACATLTIVAEKFLREITLDFGQEGCMVRGHLLRGQIVFSYNRNPELKEVLITYDLIDFFFDAKSVKANRTILRELSNDNGNPMFTHSLDLVVTWPNGLTASREGTKVREWVEGFGSGEFNDNVFEVTGNWNTSFINGNSHAYEVTIPLRREVMCSYFVSGSFSVDRTNFGGVFDFGDGECDDQATFTFNNGQEVNINLN